MQSNSFVTSFSVFCLFLAIVKIQVWEVKRQSVTITYLETRQLFWLNFIIMMYNLIK